MDRILAYFESVPVAVLVGAPIAVALLFFLTPARLRVPVFLGALGILLPLGQFVELGAIQAVARVAVPGMMGLTIAAAILDPSPKRSPHPASWGYILIAFFGFLFIITVEERAFAFVLRIQWVLVTVMAYTVSRLLVDEESLRRLLVGFTLGLCCVLVVPVLALLKNPGEAFRQGVGRFEPWGAASNQIGIYFGMTAPLAMYFGFSSKLLWRRWFFFGCAAVALSMTLITASRSSLIVAAFGSLPIALRMTKRPIVLITAGAVVLLAAGWFLGFMNTEKLDRLKSLDTARFEQFFIYMNIISERPFLGLLETSGASILVDESVDWHPHNAYLEALYYGGFSYGIPLFLLAGYTMLSAARIWRGRKMLAMDPLFVTFLTAMTFLVYAHGFVNGAIYYPTYAWAFFHFLLSMFIMTLARDVRLAESSAPAADSWDAGAAAEPLPAPR
jgi:hypothetical protein